MNEGDKGSVVTVMTVLTMVDMVQLPSPLSVSTDVFNTPTLVYQSDHRHFTLCKTDVCLTQESSRISGWRRSVWRERPWWRWWCPLSSEGQTLSWLMTSHTSLLSHSLQCCSRKSWERWGKSTFLVVVNGKLISLRLYKQLPCIIYWLSYEAETRPIKLWSPRCPRYLHFIRDVRHVLVTKPSW